MSTSTAARSTVLAIVLLPLVSGWIEHALAREAPAFKAASRAETLMQSGADAFAVGEYGTAERDWRQAELAYAAAGDVRGRLDAAMSLGAVLQQHSAPFLMIGDWL